jgi:hypothetical protein
MRKLAAKFDISDTSAIKVRRANGVKPHLTEAYKASRPPRFFEKLDNILGLAISPLEDALVHCCDEKSHA